MRRIIGIVAVVAAATLATACADGGTTPVNASVTSTATAAPTGLAGPSSTRTPTGSAQPASGGVPATAGNGKCLDPKSPVVTAAVATLSPADDHYPWGATDEGTDAAVGSCPALLWMFAGPMNASASTAMYVMLFNNAGYLGTATAKPTSYPWVVGSSDRSVQIEYQWLTGGEAMCCPSGGPVVVTLTLGPDNHTVTPDREFPREVTDPAPYGTVPICPVAKTRLLEVLKDSGAKSLPAQPIELEDQITCSTGWAMAHTTTNRTDVLFHYVTREGWKFVDIGSALRCTDLGVPADLATQLCATH